jgi:hypothetical protein
MAPVPSPLIGILLASDRLLAVHGPGKTDVEFGDRRLGHRLDRQCQPEN